MVLFSLILALGRLVDDGIVIVENIYRHMSNGEPAMRMTKKPAFFEGRFQIDKVGNMTPREEMNLILSFLMLVILERRRG